MDNQRIEVQHIDPSSNDLYASRPAIYVRRVKGLFRQLRVVGGSILLGLFFLTPFINWQGRQAIFFDLVERQFHFFATTFWPQDFMLLSLLLVVLAFTLFFVTVFAGRVWCGYSCPQSVWTWMFMFIEEKTEGSRQQRIRQDKTKASAQLIARKLLKHGLWLALALLTALAFVGYFSPIRQLIPNLLSLNLSGWAGFWLLFFTLATYLNAGWLREQVCIYMCPYARFQSVMFDSNTLIVSYDTARGEPRGARKKQAEPPTELGSCIDCELCVQVCPTGIDIRDGLQYECITCAACIDACDSVMAKMDYPKGLIRYTTENALNGQPSRILRPRLFGYGAVLMAMLAVFALVLNARVAVDLGVDRDRGQLNRVLSDGRIENTYSLQVMNLDSQPRQFSLSAQADFPFEWRGPQQIDLQGASNTSIAIAILAPGETLDLPSYPINFVVQALDDPSQTTQSRSSFISQTRR